MMLQTYEGVIQRGHIRLPAGTPMPNGIRVLVTFLPTVDERSARRKANGWLGENVGNLVMAMEGKLGYTGDRPVWHFGAYTSSVLTEPFGPIGFVDVDAETSEILTGLAEAEEMAERGVRQERIPA